MKKAPTSEFFYFALRNPKFVTGAVMIILLVLVAMIGPLFAKYGPREFSGPLNEPPSESHWLGTTKFGEDVYSQLTHGMRLSFEVGLLSGTLATLIGLTVGFIAGYRGGWFDEILMMVTNVALVFPTIAILIIVSAYFKTRGVLLESFIIGFTAWPWVARCVRAQAMSLREREFVNLARISGSSHLSIIVRELAPNMASYVLLVYIIEFGSTILIAAGLDFIGLGPTMGISLGLMTNYAFNEAALTLGNWWWSILPGLVITLMVAALYFANTGLDEVFNPKLRET